jgi:hypothetical protein
MKTYMPQVNGCGRSFPHYAALADELQKWINIIPVRCLKRRDVRSAALVHSLKIMPARPVDGFRTIDAIKHRIRHNARMPSIAIGKRMNLYETMVQAGRSFRRPVRGDGLLPKWRATQNKTANSYTIEIAV